MSNESSGRSAAAGIRRFFNSKAFYPVALGIIFALCVCIWLVGKAGNTVKKSAATDQASTTQVAATVTDVADTRTTESSSESPSDSDGSGENTQTATTYEYENNAAGEGEWSMPLRSTTISKDYSNGTLVKSKTMGDYRVHDGIDFEADTGTEVTAVNSGAVEDVYNDAFWGTVVTVNHGGGVIVKYCGLDTSVSVKKGDIISKGDTIGKVGTVPCENADGSHLHLETWVNGEAMDPMLCFNMSDGGE